MIVPMLLQRVRIRGQDDVFTVTHVYTSLGVVDLMPVGCDYIIERSVLFDKLEAVEDEGDEGPARRS